MGYVIIDGSNVVYLETAKTQLEALQIYTENWLSHPSQCIKIIKVTGRESGNKHEVTL